MDWESVPCTDENDIDGDFSEAELNAYFDEMNAAAEARGDAEMYDFFAELAARQAR
jgi:hypothetical protein